MKFLVLAICVCAASAATVPRVAQALLGVPGVAPVVSVAQATASVGASPFVAAAKTVYQPNKEVESGILRQETEVQPDGFNYVYETSNGVAVQSRGVLKKADNVDVLAHEGSFRYTAPDGTPVQITYVADETGFHPSGDVLPVAPEIPAAIARSLEWIAAHPSSESKRV